MPQFKNEHPEFWTDTYLHLQCHAKAFKIEENNIVLCVFTGGDVDPTEIEDLFEELEDLSDSGPEIDTMSISSTPKPSLRPFFSSSRSLLQETLNVPGKILPSALEEISNK